MTNSTFNLPSALLKARAVRLSPDSPFTWASGMKAPIYCDNRQLLGFPYLRGQIAEALVTAINEMDRLPTLIAGTSTAGIPWASMVAERMRLPLSYVRTEPKKHGMGRQVEGPLAKNHCVVLIEDLISTGGSSHKCVEALRAEGADVMEILALFTYELAKAEETFTTANIRWRALATFSELAEKAVEIGLVSQAGSESLATWKRDPEKWGFGG